MVLRNIMSIDEEKCNGCSQCVIACAEGAIKVIDGKAKLVSEIYCDGLAAMALLRLHDRLLLKTKLK